MRHVLLVLAILGTTWPVAAQVPFAEVSSDTTHALGLPRCTAQDALRVCLTTDAAEAFVVTVERDGSETARWPYLGPGFLLELRAFTLPTEDGTNATLVATYDAVSNGMAVSFWTLTMMVDGVPTYRLRVEEFGRDGGSFAVHDGQPIVWATEWVGGPDPAGERVDGLYFTGRPFALSAAGLTPLAEVSVRARRFLNSFARDEQGPVAWLRDPRTESRPVDPALTGCTSTSEAVRVTEVEEAIDQWREPYVRVALQDRADVLGVGQRMDADGLLSVSYLGDEATGRLFPQGYWPPRASFANPLRLETCTRGDIVKTRVLWIEDTDAASQ